MRSSTVDRSAAPRSAYARVFSVRAFRDGDEAEIARLFRRAFPDVPSRSECAWRWEYAECPRGRQVMVAEDDVGRIIAHYAMLPLPMHVDGEVALTGHCVDSMADPRWPRGLRRDGPFLATARRWFERWGRPDVAHCGYGFPNARALRFGRRFLGYVPLIAPIPTLYHNRFEPTSLDLAVAPDLHCREVRRLGHDVDELWRRCAPRLPLAIVRDRRYLNWRFADCPAPYRIFELRRGARLAAVFVTRADWCRAPILIVADYLGHDEDADALRAALSVAHAVATAGRQGRIELWFPERHPFFRLARRFGLRTEPTLMTFVTRLYRARHGLGWHRRRWYYTLGDSDVL